MIEQEFNDLFTVKEKLDSHLLNLAKGLFEEQGKLSTAYLMRKLKINGYTAQKIMHALEAENGC